MKAKEFEKRRLIDRRHNNFNVVATYKTVYTYLCLTAEKTLAITNAAPIPCLLPITINYGLEFFDWTNS